MRTKTEVTTRTGLVRTDRALAHPNFEDVLIAIDRSGSMADRDTCLGTTRIQAARDAYQALLDATDYDMTNYAVCFWDYDADLHVALTRDYLALVNMAFPQPRGGTMICPPIELALSFPAKRIIILTDGHASDGRAAKDLAVSLKGILVIDTVGIGEHDEELLQFLSEATGGVYRSPKNYEDLLNTFVELETRNRLLLEHK